jgi:hypothetical protein
MFEEPQPLQVPEVTPRLPSGALINPYDDVPFGCDECMDVKWVRIPISEEGRKYGEADHYMRECSQCLPDRHQMMVVENHNDHWSAGGCFKCRKYIQPWNKK